MFFKKKIGPSPITVSDEELISLDVLQFNDGENPSNSAKDGFGKPSGYFRDIIRSHSFERQGRVLDLMCGFGRWSVFLAEANREVVGLDQNEGAIRIARGVSEYLGAKNTSFIAADISGLADFPDASFDAIWSWNSLIYVDRGFCMTEANRILRPNGRVLIAQMNSTGRLLEKLIEGLDGDTPRHGTLRKQALEALSNGPLYDGRPNYCTEADAPAVFGAHGFAIDTMSVGGRRVLDKFPSNLDISLRKT